MKFRNRLIPLLLLSVAIATPAEGWSGLETPYFNPPDIPEFFVLGRRYEIDCLLDALMDSIELYGDHFLWTKGGHFVWPYVSGWLMPQAHTLANGTVVNVTRFSSTYEFRAQASDDGQQLTCTYRTNRNRPSVSLTIRVVRSLCEPNRCADRATCLYDANPRDKYTCRLTNYNPELNPCEHGNQCGDGLCKLGNETHPVDYYYCIHTVPGYTGSLNL